MKDSSSMPKSRHRNWSVPLHGWPEADQKEWQEACRPGVRLKPGGRASRFAEASLKDFTNRYGAFLGSLQRRGILDLDAAPAAQVTRPNVDSYVMELKERRVSSVTIWNCVYKLRRVAELLDPRRDFTWLAKTENEAALVMTPRAKFDRLVLTNRLVEAGLALIDEEERSMASPLDRARGVRNGLMIVILGLTHIRLKNFVALEIDKSFKLVNGSWWVCVPAGSIKNKRWVEKRIPNAFNRVIEFYLNEARPILLKSLELDGSLWISSRTGRRYTYKNLSKLISKITLQTVGIDVSPHLFRTAAASTAATKMPGLPHLASALLGHADPRVADEHYKRATSLSSGRIYADYVQEYFGDSSKNKADTRGEFERSVAG